jgi:hypothetical protein
MNQQPLWVLDPDSTKFVNRPVSIVPGLYKIVDEILVNAADNKVHNFIRPVIVAWTIRKAYYTFISSLTVGLVVY